MRAVLSYSHMHAVVYQVHTHRRCKKVCTRLFTGTALGRAMPENYRHFYGGLDAEAACAGRPKATFTALILNLVDSVYRESAVRLCAALHTTGTAGQGVGSRPSAATTSRVGATSLNAHSIHAQPSSVLRYGISCISKLGVGESRSAAKLCTDQPIAASQPPRASGSWQQQQRSNSRIQACKMQAAAVDAQIGVSVAHLSAHG